MALYKQPRSSFWNYDVTIERRRYRGSTRCDTKTAAKAFEARLIVSIQENGFAAKPQKSTTTLLAYIPRFKDWVDRSQQLRPNSKRFYRDGLVVLKRSTLANVPLARIHEDMVDTTVFARLSGEPASAHQSNQALSTLRRLLNKARRWGDIREVPSIRLRDAPGRDAVISPECEDQIIASLQRPEKHGAVRGAREAAIDVYLMMHDGGMRTSEAVASRIENIEWAAKRIFIANGKSKRAKRWVPLSDRLVERLRSRCNGRSEGWVFPSSRSVVGHLVGPWRSFRKACRNAGVSDDILLYTGRHTFGTEMMEATGNVFAVSQAMGHQDIKSMNPYQHHNPARLGDAINQRLSSRHTLRHTVLTFPEPAAAQVDRNTALCQRA